MVSIASRFDNQAKPFYRSCQGTSEWVCGGDGGGDKRNGKEATSALLRIGTTTEHVFICSFNSPIDRLTDLTQSPPPYIHYLIHLPMEVLSLSPDSNASDPTENGKLDGSIEPRLTFQSIDRFEHHLSSTQTRSSSWPSLHMRHQTSPSSRI